MTFLRSSSGQRVVPLVAVFAVGLLFCSAGCADDREAAGTSSASGGSDQQSVARESVAPKPVVRQEPESTATSNVATTLPAPPTTLAPPVTVGRTGVFSVAPGSSAVSGSGPLLTYTVEVEESLGLDPVEVAESVDATLADPRSWAAHGEASVQRVDGASRVRIIVASPPTVDAACLPLNTAGQLSCRSGDRVNINADRWMGATADWTTGIEAYRSYVVNHEVGHALGHGHEQCPGAGELAPLMMQQTKGLGGCLPNAWPFPS